MNEQIVTLIKHEIEDLEYRLNYVNDESDIEYLKYIAENIRDYLDGLEIK